MCCDFEAIKTHFKKQSGLENKIPTSELDDVRLARSKNPSDNYKSEKYEQRGRADSMRFLYYF